MQKPKKHRTAKITELMAKQICANAVEFCKLFIRHAFSFTHDCYVLCNKIN